MREDVSKADLLSAWQSDDNSLFLKDQLVFVDNQTASALIDLWGKPGKHVQIVDHYDIYDQAINGHYGYAILPFEDLEPVWKVISLDGNTPLEKQFNISQYPLLVPYGFKNTTVGSEITKEVEFPKGNFDPKKMTILTMTGTTGLVRALGENMEKEGVNYPAEGGILSWFVNSDFVHISNEVSFSTDCPHAKKGLPNLQFCSRPEYIGLLDYIHANIIE